MKKILLSSILAVSLLGVNAIAKDFSIDKAHSSVGFKIKHLQISNISGSFKDYNANIDFNSDTFEFNKLQANVKISSIDTDNQTRDTHLQGDDFFKTKKYPEMTFTMSKYEKISNEKGKMYGTLNIAGVSKDIVLDTEFGGVAKMDNGKEKVGFALKGEIKRSDFKFAPETSTLKLGDEITINIDAQMSEK